jgi:hypothetical protein
MIFYFLIDGSITQVNKYILRYLLVAKNFLLLLYSQLYFQTEIIPLKVP